MFLCPIFAWWVPTYEVHRSETLLVICGKTCISLYRFLSPPLLSSTLVFSTLSLSSLSYKFHQIRFQTSPRWKRTRKPSPQSVYRTGASSSTKHASRLPLRLTDMRAPERTPIPLLSAGFQTTLGIPWSSGPRRSGS
jgi:hypothetical protein